ncbi:hypothetical protein MRB53_016238 [Persea americana]|uniref:Uncharacterized protein n=1 Tax=Persea americana TaxID=3435 RepID=A0ACC2M1T5_PERAE|nr:hypothetical protein MRB53_016238 [Persea americana]|eukprot:TRINITY_DN22278_c0_g1_i2.p1 TRINITY_DN22278_c0_g1~~TRINITY_DN22278_c0_g1_i2.p1  ORF type:complete len:177 (-),score=20.83 TRINITY_DN22278_c0_g1_i2:115-645(-)
MEWTSLFCDDFLKRGLIWWLSTAKEKAVETACLLQLVRLRCHCRLVVAAKSRPTVSKEESQTIGCFSFSVTETEEGKRPVSCRGSRLPSHAQINLSCRTKNRVLDSFGLSYTRRRNRESSSDSLQSVLIREEQWPLPLHCHQCNAFIEEEDRPGEREDILSTILVVEQRRRDLVPG